MFVWAVTIFKLVILNEIYLYCYTDLHYSLFCLHNSMDLDFPLDKELRFGANDTWQDFLIDLKH